jgi:hypothetical protein
MFNTINQLPDKVYCTVSAAAIEPTRGQLVAFNHLGAAIGRSCWCSPSVPRARGGARLVLKDDGGCLTVTATPDADQTGGFTIAFTPAGKRVTDALPAARFLAAMARAARFSLTLDGYPQLDSRITGSVIEESDAVATV